MPLLATERTEMNLKEFALWPIPLEYGTGF